MIPSAPSVPSVASFSPPPCSHCGRPCPDDDPLSCCGLPFCSDPCFERHAAEFHPHDGALCQVCGRLAVGPDYIYCARCAATLEPFDAL